MPTNESAQYYQNNLSDNPADFQAFAAPAMRQYNEDIMPGIAEQYAGMGAGGTSSSGFQNAQIQGATDLSERLGALRAQLRQSSAQGLQNIRSQSAQGLQGISSQALGNYSQNMTTQQGTEGLGSQIAPLVGTVAGAYFGGAPGAMAGHQAGQMLNNSMSGNKVGANTSPYGGSSWVPQSSPRLGQTSWRGA